MSTPPPDRADGVSRRDFVRAVAGAALVGGLAPRGHAMAAGGTVAAETAVKRFYDALDETQRKVICLPFDHPLRTRINANWAVTKPKIGDYFTNEQKAILDEIVRGVTSPDGYDRMMRQMKEDSGGIGDYHVAVFGTPGKGQFEWELTGRHATLRADGDSVAGTAFGGPIIYGHGAGENEKGLPGNVFYYQTQKANEVFRALDGAQRKSALVAKAPSESDVQVQGDGGTFPGIAVGTLAPDQKALVESVIKVILAPYRADDVAEACSILNQGGGVDGLRMAFYENDDIGDDQEWDLWRIEGPTFVAHFRGSPHVHAYLNVAKKA